MFHTALGAMRDSNKVNLKPNLKEYQCRKKNNLQAINNKTNHHKGRNNIRPNSLMQPKNQKLLILPLVGLPYLRNLTISKA